MIYADRPADWRALEERVSLIFSEIGCRSFRGAEVTTVRGDVAVDVVVHDETRRPHTLILCECKLWERKVSKTVVHAFRTVVQDSGANLGFIISDAGFQPGAFEAAVKANIKLVTWNEFQTELHERWLAAMAAKLGALSDELYQLAYPEPTKRRETLIDEAIEVGGHDAWEEYSALRERYPAFYATSPLAGGDPSANVPAVANGTTWSETFWRYFDSPREYFDELLVLAPRIFSEYAAFIAKYCDGRFGSQQVFADEAINQIAVGSTTKNAVKELLCDPRAWIYRQRDLGEQWRITGSITSFEPPTALQGTSGRSLFAETRWRSLCVEFGPDEIALNVLIEEDRYFGHP